MASAHLKTPRGASLAGQLRLAPSKRLLTCLLVLWAAACPQERTPREPRDALACARHEDCNCGADCGALDACIDGFCETGRSMLVPCRDEQTPRRPDCQPR